MDGDKLRFNRLSSRHAVGISCTAREKSISLKETREFIACFGFSRKGKRTRGYCRGELNIRAAAGRAYRTAFARFLAVCINLYGLGN